MFYWETLFWHWELDLTKVQLTPPRTKRAWSRSALTAFESKNPFCPSNALQDVPNYSWKLKFVLITRVTFSESTLKGIRYKPSFWTFYYYFKWSNKMTEKRRKLVKALVVSFVVILGLRHRTVCTFIQILILTLKALLWLALHQILKCLLIFPTLLN